MPDAVLKWQKRLKEDKGVGGGCSSDGDVCCCSTFFASETGRVRYLTIFTRDIWGKRRAGNFSE